MRLGERTALVADGEEFDAAAAYRIGLVQEIAEDPLAVQASLTSSCTGRSQDWMPMIAASEDLQEGIRSPQGTVTGRK